MVRIILCDEDTQDREILEAYCRHFFQGSQEEYELRICSVKEIDLQDTRADLLMIDVETGQMRGGLITGMDGEERDRQRETSQPSHIPIKDMLQQIGVGTRILLVGRHTESMSQAFGKNVFGFLKKPVEYPAFCEKMAEICRDVKQQGTYVRVRTSEGERLLCTRDMIYIEADGKYSKVYLKAAADPCLVYEGFGVLKSRIEAYGFYVSSRGVLVNLAYVKQVQRDVILWDGSKAPLSRRMKKEFKEVFREYQWKNPGRGF